MDCDDLLLQLASPGHDQAQVDAHLATCDACRELVEDSEVEEQDPETLPEVDSLLGHQIGSYRITKRIGSGGMGVVYLAVHDEIGSRVAIKVFSRDWSRDSSLVARFFAEARATNAISHENIVNVLDVGHLDDGRPYLVMEYLLGQSLAELVGSRELTDDVVQRLMLDVLGALDAAHEHGIIHRDLKPDNIFVSPEQRATLLDFGIAKLRPDLSAGVAETVSGVVLGTPQYMSPEQATGGALDERADLYAIGVILYECFLGRRPFEGASLFQLLDKQVNHAPISPRAIRPELGTDLETVILTALEKRREARFGSARELHEALARCEVSRDRGAFSVPPDTWEQQAGSTRRRSKTANQAATVAERPHARARARPARRAAIVLPIVAVVSVLAIVGWMLLRPGPGTTSPVEVVPVASPGQLDAQVPERVASIELDAAIEPVVTPPDAPSAPSKIVKPATVKPKGFAPLSLLDDADEAARNHTGDALLYRVRISGLSSTGLIDRQAGGEVIFDYVSASLVATVTKRAPDRKLDLCTIRVTYGAAATPSVKKMSGPCATLRAIPPPRCSMAALLLTVPSNRRRSAAFPTHATLEVSPLRNRPRWKIAFEDDDYYFVDPC